MPVLLRKVPVDGKRPGDTFTRQGTAYRVVQVRSLSNGRGNVFVTESPIYGREVWL